MPCDCWLGNLYESRLTFRGTATIMPLTEDVLLYCCSATIFMTDKSFKYEDKEGFGYSKRYGEFVSLRWWDQNVEATTALCLKPADIYHLSSEKTREQGSERGLRKRGFEDHSAAMHSVFGAPSRAQKKTLSLSSNLHHVLSSSPSLPPALLLNPREDGRCSRGCRRFLPSLASFFIYSH